MQVEGGEREGPCKSKEGGILFGINFPYTKRRQEKKEEKKEMVDKLDNFSRMKPTTVYVLTTLQAYRLPCVQFYVYAA